MPRIDPSATRGGRNITPTRTTPTACSPAARSRTPAVPRSKTKPLIPLPVVKRSKPSKQPRTIEKGSIPRKSPELEEDGEWDLMRVCFVRKPKEAPAVEDTLQSPERLAATLADQKDPPRKRVDHWDEETSIASRHDKMPFSCMKEATLKAGHEEGNSNRGAMQPLPSRQPSATEAVARGRESSLPVPSGGNGLEAAEKVHRHQRATGKRSREVVEADETESQQDPIRRPSTRRDVRRSESFHPPPPPAPRDRSLVEARLPAGLTTRHLPAGQGGERQRLPRNTLFDGVVEVILPPPTPLPPRAKPLTYMARRTARAGLPVPAMPPRPPSRQAIARPTPVPKLRRESVLASHRKAPERSLEVMKDHEEDPRPRLTAARGSSPNSDPEDPSPSSQSSRASGIDIDELEDPAPTLRLQGFNAAQAESEADTRPDRQPRNQEPAHRDLRRDDADRPSKKTKAKRRKIDPSSTARSERDSFHLPSPASPSRNSTPQPLSRVCDPHQFRLYGDLGMRMDGWSDDEEMVQRRYQPVKGGKGGRKTIMIESNASTGQLKLSRNQSVLGRLKKYREVVGNERRLHPITPTRNIIPSPKSTSKKPAAVSTARSLPLAAFKPRQRKIASSDSTTKGFQAIDQNLVAAGNRDLLDQILVSGVKKGRGAAGAGKKRPQTPPHHQHLRSGPSATTDRQAVENPEPIWEFTPAPPTQPRHDLTPVRQVPRVRPGQLSFISTDPVPRGERAPLQTPTTRLRQEQKKYEDQWDREKAAYLQEVEDTVMPPPEPPAQAVAPPVKTPPAVQITQVRPPVAPSKKPAETAKTTRQPKHIPMTPTRPAQHPPATHLPLPPGRPLAEITVSFSPQSTPSLEVATAEPSSTQLLRDLDNMLAAAPMSDTDAEKLASELDEMIETSEAIHGDEHFANIQCGTKNVAKRVRPEQDAQGGMSGLDMTEHILKTLHLLHDDLPVEASPGSEAGGIGGKKTSTLSTPSGGLSTASFAGKTTTTRPRKGKKAIFLSKNGAGDTTQGKLNFRPVEPIELDSQIPRTAPIDNSYSAAGGVSSSLLSSALPGSTSQLDAPLPESTPQVIWSATPAVLTQPLPGTTQGDPQEAPPVEYKMADPGISTFNRAARDRATTKAAGRDQIDKWRTQMQTGAALKATSSRIGGASPRSGTRPKWATDNEDTQDTSSVVGLNGFSPTQIGTTPGKSSGPQASNKSFPIASTVARTQSAARSGAQAGRKKRTMVPVASDSSDEAANGERDELDGDSTEEEDEVESPQPRPAAMCTKPVNPGYAVKQPISHQGTTQAQPDTRQTGSKIKPSVRDVSVTGRASIASKALGLRPTRTPSKARASVVRTESFASASSVATPAARAPFKPPSRTPSLALSLAPEPSLGGQRALNTWEMSDTEEDEEVNDN